jgi:addiction module RelE/StbE family toxin
MYKIHYLPLALDDLKEIVRYITYKLEAPRAAERLILKIEREMKKIADNPYRCHIFSSAEKLKNEYRVLHVNNYSLFYVVENEKVEIYRVIYARRDIPKILKKTDNNKNKET